MYFGIAVFLVIVGISMGYISNPFVKAPDNSTSASVNISETATNPDLPDQTTGSQKWAYFIIGAAIGYAIKKGGDSFVGKGVEEVEADIRKFAKDSQGIKYLKIVTIKEISKGVWDAYFVNMSSIHETGGRHHMNDGFRVRYEGNKIKKFERAVFDPIARQYMTQEQAAKPQPWYSGFFPKKNEEGEQERQAKERRQQQPKERQIG
jgi:hypothetical protein